MKLRIRREAPEHIFPVDDWKIIQTKFDPKYVAHEETVYALSNGYLGMRGGFVEGRPAVDDGTLINGFYEFRPIVYPEEAYGFPRQGQTIVYVPEAKIIRLYVDDEPFDVASAELTHFRRTLDMKGGLLVREVEWITPQGKRVALKTTRIVSFRQRHLAAIDYELTLPDAPAEIDISSELVNPRPKAEESLDPRKAPLFGHKVLMIEGMSCDDQRIIQCYRTQLSNYWVSCGIDHEIETDCDYKTEIKSVEDFGNLSIMADMEPGKTLRLTKYIAYHTEQDSKASELNYRVETTLARAKEKRFERLAEERRDYLDDFWRRSDVRVSVIEPLVGSGDTARPRGQQIIRWNLFQLLQASARVEGFSIPARGLTGRVYEGHYFWDAEIYEVPFLIYTAPEAARHLLKHRYEQLDQARNRARELSHQGALFPWRTINGDEASTFFLASTAQYHIDACIMYAVKKYVDVTGDEDFLFDMGAEMYIETARLWISLGYYPDRHPDRFYISGVTGPDEYTALVNNNFFTNVMAQDNLWNAAQVVERMERERPDAFRALAAKTGLDKSEVEAWRKAADAMFLPYDETLGIHLQDDSFLDKENMDVERLPPEKFPLLLHYHYLEIYRHQVIKQADTILAMFLLGHRFTIEEKKRNFDYYDPITTGDSSLSACIQSIAAAEIGYTDKALDYLRFAAVMDLSDVAGNVVDGAHLASIGGTWLALVYGLGGLRDYGGQIRFEPNVPENVESIRFPLTIRGQVIEVDARPSGTTYTLREGAGLEIEHQGQTVKLEPGKSVKMPTASKRANP